MNDLSRDALATWRRRRLLSCEPIPPAVPLVAVPLVLVGLAVSLFILVVVHNALFLAFLLLLSLLLLSFFFWNVYCSGGDRAAFYFLDSVPLSDLQTAVDGQIVKISGLASCGDLSLESSYEKVDRCVYTSTLLYEYSGFATNANNRCFSWNLTHVERFTADFYITDTKSGIRALVKAGYTSKINPLVEENILVNTSSGSRELSSTLKKWLDERHLSDGVRLLRLKEGYIKEGSHVTVMGMLSKKSGVLMIIPAPEPITTGCLFRKLLLPIDIDGLILSVPSNPSSTLTSAFPNPYY